jgi:hypothetical protein
MLSDLAGVLIKMGSRKDGKDDGKADGKVEGLVETKE